MSLESLNDIESAEIKAFVLPHRNECRALLAAFPVSTRTVTQKLWLALDNTVLRVNMSGITFRLR